MIRPGWVGPVTVVFVIVRSRGAPKFRSPAVSSRTSVGPNALAARVSGARTLSRVAVTGPTAPPTIRVLLLPEIVTVVGCATRWTRTVPPGPGLIVAASLLVWAVARIVLPLAVSVPWSSTHGELPALARFVKVTAATVPSVVTGRTVAADRARTALTVSAPPLLVTLTAVPVTLTVAVSVPRPSFRRTAPMLDWVMVPGAPIPASAVPVRVTARPVPSSESS